MMLQVGEGCSASCLHCPFTKDGKWRSIEQVIEEAIGTPDGYVTLTGGEPLEHPEILAICMELSTLEVPFRIATGGHVPLQEIFPQLTNLPGFLGFNLGSDVVSSRNKSEVFKQVWWQNVNTLSSCGVPWSLTFTLGQDLDHSNLITELQNKNYKPSFLMINETFAGWMEQPVFKLLSEGKWSDLAKI